MSEYLSATELHDLTGYARSGQQAAWLQFRKIPHRVDGRRVILSRRHVRDWLEGKSVVTSSGINMAAAAK